MWKHINTARCVLRRSLQAILGIAAFAIISPAPSHAAVEYEKVCSLYGAGFFYIPGTDTCANARSYLRAPITRSRRTGPCSTDNMPSGSRD